MQATLSDSGDNPCAEMVCPRYDTLFEKNSHFSRLIFAPFSTNLSQSWCVLAMHSVSSLPPINKSSKKAKTPSRSRVISSMRCWNNEGAAWTPKGNRLYRNNPLDVLMTNKFDVSSDTGIWWNASARSSFEKTRMPANRAYIWSMVGEGYMTISVILFTVRLNAPHILNCPLFLTTTTMGAATLLDCTGSRTPRCVNTSRASATRASIAYGTAAALNTRHVADVLTCNSTGGSIHPKSLWNNSEYLDSNALMGSTSLTNDTPNSIFSLFHTKSDPSATSQFLPISEYPVSTTTIGANIFSP